MKKVLSLASIAAVFLFGCSADGFFDEQGHITWGKTCRVGDQCTQVQSKSQCDAVNGTLVLRSECPK